MSFKGPSIPPPPKPEQAAESALIAEAKRTARRGPSDITNVGGAKGLLTDPNTKLNKPSLLGKGLSLNP